MSVRSYELATVVDACFVPSPSGLQELAKIASVTYLDDHVFVGTTNGRVCRYGVVEICSPAGRRTYKTKFRACNCLDQKKVIRKLQAVPGINRLVVLCDTVLHLMDAATLECVQSSSARIRSVADMSVNDRIDSSTGVSVLQVCVAYVKKSHVSLYQIGERSFHHNFDVSLPDPSTAICYSHPFVSASTVAEYLLIRLMDGADSTACDIVSLFPLTGKNAVMASLPDDNEFLLAGPGGLGMFVSGMTAVAQRPPINWAELDVHNIVFTEPHVVVCSATDVWIYSVHDQQPKQSIACPGCRAVCHARFVSPIRQSDGERRRTSAPCKLTKTRTVLASADQVFALVPLPWQDQVDSLMSEGCVEEAVSVAESFIEESPIENADFDSGEYLRALKRTAGFALLAQMQLDDAAAYFAEANVNPLEVTAIQSGLLPPECSFQCPSDIDADVFNTLHFKLFLLRYLRTSRNHYAMDSSSPKANAILLGVDTSIVKLLAELANGAETPINESPITRDKAFYRQQLINCICDPSFLVSYSTVSWLLHYNELHAAALLHKRYGDASECLKCWRSILRLSAEAKAAGDTVPSSTKLIETNVFDMLALPENVSKDLLLSNLEWLIPYDAEQAVSTILAREDLVERDVIDFLVRYPAVQLRILEEYVTNRWSRDETLHTILAIKYFEKAKAFADGTAPDRRKLRNFIEMSGLLDATFLLTKMRQVPHMRREVMLLHGMLGEHRKALDIVVGELGDFDGAIDYCFKHSMTADNRRPRQIRRELFQLLMTYVDTSAACSDGSTALERTTRLLNDARADFDAESIVASLSADWSVVQLRGFLMHSLRRSLHDCRERQIESALRRALLRYAQLTSVKLKRPRVTQGDPSRCAICCHQLSATSFARLSDNRIVHLHCTAPEERPANCNASIPNVANGALAKHVIGAKSETLGTPAFSSSPTAQSSSCR